MRHSNCKISLFIALALLAGCGSTPHHTNVMVFGTNTKFGLDASVNPAGGTPDFTVGYKRQEVVWMPLLANQSFPPTPVQCPNKCDTVSPTKKTACEEQCTAERLAPRPGKCGSTNCMFVGADSTANGEGSNDTRKDTYSVLASFGAEFGGRATGSGGQGTSASGSGGLAQFFATGLAARDLANRGGARLVSIQGADSETKDILMENLYYQKAESERIESRLVAALGEDQYQEIASGTAAKKKNLQAKIKEIAAHVTNEEGNLDKAAWAKLVDDATLPEGLDSDIKPFETLDELNRFLSVQIDGINDGVINALHEEIGGKTDD